jgi:ABC-type sugar transport system permease subunit
VDPARHTRRSGARERLIDLSFLAPTLLVLGAFLLYPLLYGLDLSLNRTVGFEVAEPIGLEHYARAIFGDAVFRQGLANTAVLTGAAVVLQTGLGLILAVLISEVRWGRTLFRVAFAAPFVIASVAAGAVWSFMYAPFFGVVPSIGSFLGIDASTFAPLADPTTALWAIVVAFVWRYAGFVSVIYVAAIQSIPKDYFEYAQLEGISWWSRLRRITWPLLWPQTFALTLLTTIATLRVFDLVWIMTAGGPGHATETVATHVYTTAFRSLDVGYAQAMATILMVVIVALAIIEYRFLNRRAEAVAA